MGSFPEWEYDSRRGTPVENKLTTITQAVSLIEDGNSLGIASPAVNPTALVPMATIREIVRQQKRDLSLVSAMGNIESDMLIGAGCLNEVQFWVFNLFGTGPPPNFRRAALAGSVALREHSEFSLTLGVLAGSMGVQFIPLHGYQNDHLKHHPEWRTFESPLDGKELLAVTAIAPDVAVIHVPKSDTYGNAQLGSTNDDNVMSRFMAPRMVQAAKRVIVTAEEIVPNDEIRANPGLTEILYHDVDAVVHVPRGAHPYGIAERYGPDQAHIDAYRGAADDAESFEAYLQRYVYEPHDHEAYLGRVDAAGGESR